eukprot:TRINITY_DN10335_c0_g1_i2.p1 TRINITY_DN10335_c0_g1~~TRINITY_DN10335_c0_g1_i2.p1  ORF type:complete len:366 (-),score=75.29 TRINITY_DN10335_c0_g1_i2:126-1223(-)
MVDLFDDLQMRRPGDQRPWEYKLGGFVVKITFEALTIMQFPLIKMNNVDGLATTVSLPMKPIPEVLFTVYQAIWLSDDRNLHSQIEIIQKTPDPVLESGERAIVLLRTKLVKGFSPFWGEKVKVAVFSKRDTFTLQMLYQDGKIGVRQKEPICEISVPELIRLATATESRRWYAFMDKFLGGCLGVGILALTNLAPLKDHSSGFAQNQGTPPRQAVISFSEAQERVRMNSRRSMALSQQTNHQFVSQSNFQLNPYPSNPQPNQPYTQPHQHQPQSHFQPQTQLPPLPPKTNLSQSTYPTSSTKQAPSLPPHDTESYEMQQQPLQRPSRPSVPAPAPSQRGSGGQINYKNQPLPPLPSPPSSRTLR